MWHLLSLLLISSVLQAGTAFAQREISRVESNNAQPSKLEGVTIRNGNSTMLVISNTVTIKASSESISRSNRTVAPTFLQKLGQFEVHKLTKPLDSSEAYLAPTQSFSINGKPVPTFAEKNASKDYVGTAYLNDTKRIGLISNEIAVRFKTGSVPSQFVSLGPIELVKGTGLYIFKASDIYAWLKLVANFQVDPQVAFVEPRIFTEFDKVE